MIERRREGSVSHGAEGEVEEPAGYDDVLAQVDPVEAGTKTQLDPSSEKPAPEG